MITLDQCFAEYEGTLVNVDGVEADTGQCVQWADVVLMQVYGQHIHYGNAIDWWNDPGDLLTDGFEKIVDGSVKKGDFVIFNTKVGSQYGHIDVAMQDGTTQDFVGADSNWNRNLTVHAVHHTGAQYVLGSLRLKEGEEMLDAAHQSSLFVAYLDRLPIQAEIDRDVGKRTTEDLINALQESPEYAAIRKKRTEAYAALEGFTPVTTQLYEKKQ